MLGSQGTLEKTEAPAAASTLACLGDNTRTQKCFRTANSQKLPGNQLHLQQRVLHRQGTCTDAAKSESAGTSYIRKSSKLLDFSEANLALGIKLVETGDTNVLFSVGKSKHLVNAGLVLNTKPLSWAWSSSRLIVAFP